MTIFAYHDLDKIKVHKRLLCFGFFPDWFEWIFTSESFGNFVLENEELEIFKTTSEKFSLLKFKLTRNNNVPRYMWIPHPLAYIQLCNCIKENWDKIDERIWKDNDGYQTTSMVIPRDNDEQRLIKITKYKQLDELTTETRLIDRWLKKDDSTFIALKKQFWAKYIAHTDISWFFANIYSHAIPWALVWKDISKSNRSKTEWFNQLDYYSRLLKNDETNWIPIWPDSSHIISEIILSQIDKNLSAYKFIRYIDDYHCYSQDREGAESFIKDLSQQLNFYQLELNEKKTFIEKLPQPLTDEWVRKLQSFNFTEQPNTDCIVQFLDLATKLSNEKWDFSPFKFALKRMESYLSNNQDLKVIFLYLSNIALLHPYFIASIDKIIEKMLEVSDGTTHLELLDLIKNYIWLTIIKHSSYCRSDVIIWWFYIAKKYNIKFDDKSFIFNEINTMNDPLSMLACFAYFKESWEEILLEFYKILNSKDQQEWWIYIYELYNTDEENFEKYFWTWTVLYKDFYSLLKENKISFLDVNWNSKISEAEIEFDIDSIVW